MRVQNIGYDTSEYYTLRFERVKTLVESILRKETFTEKDEKQLDRFLRREKAEFLWWFPLSRRMRNNGLFREEMSVKPMVQSVAELRDKLNEYIELNGQKLTPAGNHGLFNYSELCLEYSRFGMSVPSLRSIFSSDWPINDFFINHPANDSDLKERWYSLTDEINRNLRVPKPLDPKTFFEDYCLSILIDSKIFEPSKVTPGAWKSITHRKAGFKVNQMSLKDALSLISLNRPRPLDGAFFKNPELTIEAQNAIIHWMVYERKVEWSLSSYESIGTRFPGTNFDSRSIVEDLRMSGILRDSLGSEREELLTKDEDTIKHRLRSYMATGLSDRREGEVGMEYDTSKAAAKFRENIIELNATSIVKLPECECPRELIDFLFEQKFEIFRLSSLERAKILVRGLVIPTILTFFYPVAGLLLCCVQIFRSFKKIKAAEAQIAKSNEAFTVWRKLRDLIPFIPHSDAE